MLSTIPNPSIKNDLIFLSLLFSFLKHFIENYEELLISRLLANGMERFARVPIVGARCRKYPFFLLELSDENSTN